MPESEHGIASESCEYKLTSALSAYLLLFDERRNIDPDRRQKDVQEPRTDKREEARTDKMQRSPDER